MRPVKFRYIVAMLLGGKMQETASLPKKPERANFVICCDYGDWSGFRTLAECQAQYRELESYNKPEGYYWVEER